MTDMKFDGGKPLAAIPIKDLGRALEAVSEVGTFGAKKYARSSWKGVENAAIRYEDALYRHAYKSSYEERDDESGLLHAAHLAWNALAILQLKLEEQNTSNELENYSPKITDTTKLSQSDLDFLKGIKHQLKWKP